MMKNCLVNYQQSIQAVRATYFTDIISRNCHSSKVSFDTTNTVLNPAATACPVPTTVTYDEFLNLFTSKIDNI